MNAFQKLSPRIQEYIYSKGWQELRGIQAGAIDAVIDGSSHVLISSGTATGKTEAAFFPILTKMEGSKAQNSIYALYIGPLKALINDQFERLQGMLEEFSLPVWRWHGDVSPEYKKKLLNNPSGILQITPESLESLLLRGYKDIPRLFGGLEFVIIDEVHAFMGTDRGSQLLCQIAKIERWAKCEPRRVGLSATLGDCVLASEWLGKGSKRKVEAIIETQAKFKISLLVDWRQKGALASEGESPEEEAYYNDLYKQVASSKSIIFANSRGEAEEAVAKLRSIAEARKQPDIFHVHHSSISKSLREEAEAAMKFGEGPIATAATLTLELGIDVGALELIAQIGAPFTCSSFVQRVGRSGRAEGKTPKLYFTYLEDAPGTGGALEAIPWPLLQMIAIIQLYAEERWIEPAIEKPCPYSLLFHQTLSYLASVGERKPSDLARDVLTLPPFRDVTQGDYRVLLNHMLNTGYLEKMDEGTIITGKLAEKMISFYTFYSVFPENEEYQVSSEGKPIGSVNALPPEGSSIVLAGRHWEVTSVDIVQKHIYVKPAKKSQSKLWKGGGGDIHSRIAERMRIALLETSAYPYLSEPAKLRLASARLYAKETGAYRRGAIRDAEKLIFLPWVGSVEMRTWAAAFKTPRIRQALLIEDFTMESGFAFSIKTELAANEFLEKLKKAVKGLEASSLAEEGKVPYVDKYDSLLPKELLLKQYASNMLGWGGDALDKRF